MEGKTTVYKMIIGNTARYIRDRELNPVLPRSGSDEEFSPALDAFTASRVIAVALCMSREDVMNDLIQFEL
jgi:hypothetical protein